MYILGIHDGHHCGASLFNDDKIICAISEERLTRSKNEYGFPKKSIRPSQGRPRPSPLIPSAFGMLGNMEKHWVEILLAFFC